MPHKHHKSQMYTPPWHLRNPHIQAILSSSQIRRSVLSQQHQSFLNQASWQELDAGEGITLAGERNIANGTKPSDTLVVLFHGWEGSSKSNYIVSAAYQLCNADFDVFRLNFRDHGDTYALNRGIFNSSLIDEVVGAVNNLQETTNYTRYAIMGFSLGGNFALRVGLHTEKLAKPLLGIFAVSPVIDPANTMNVLRSGAFWYERYFAKKWATSLRKKQEVFPEYDYGNTLNTLKTLDEMNEYFIPKYTNFDTVANYFQSYTLSGNTLANLCCPTLILAAEDDPVIPVSDFATIARPTQLSVQITPKGSHCAYLESLTKASYADRTAIEYFIKLIGKD